MTTSGAPLPLDGADGRLSFGAAFLTPNAVLRFTANVSASGRRAKMCSTTIEVLAGQAPGDDNYNSPLSRRLAFQALIDEVALSGCTMSASGHARCATATAPGVPLT